MTDELEVLTVEDLNAYSLSEGFKFECKLPENHFLRSLMAYGYDISDAYPEYWFAGGLHALAVASNKKIKASLTASDIYPNLFEMILGKSSLSRKSTAVDNTEEIMDNVLHFIDSKVPTEFSPEAFIEHMSKNQHAPWIRDEAAGVLDMMKKDYMRGFKDILMILYDCKPVHRKLRTGQRKAAETNFKVDDPYLNVLFATTDAAFGSNVVKNDTLTGFLARFLFFFPQGKKPRWLPLREDDGDKSALETVVHDHLKKIVDSIYFSDHTTTLRLSAESKDYWEKWQKEREDQLIIDNDNDSMQIFSRLNPTILKLCMLFELGSMDFDITRPMRLEFMIEACRLVDEYFMLSAKAAYDIVGSNIEKNVIDKITAFLKNNDGKVTSKQLQNHMKMKQHELNDYVNSMKEYGMIEEKEVKTGKAGRPTSWLLLVNSAKPLSSTV